MNTESIDVSAYSCPSINGSRWTRAKGPVGGWRGSSADMSAMMSFVLVFHYQVVSLIRSAGAHRRALTSCANLPEQRVPVADCRRSRHGTFAYRPHRLEDTRISSFQKRKTKKSRERERERTPNKNWIRSRRFAVIKAHAKRVRN